MCSVRFAKAEESQVPARHDDHCIAGANVDVLCTFCKGRRVSSSISNEAKDQRPEG